MNKKIIPVLIVVGAAAAAFMVWKRSRPGTTEGEAAVDNATGGGFLADFFKKFGPVAAAAPAPAPVPLPDQAVAVDNGT
jgi:hypothetical protein